MSRKSFTAASAAAVCAAVAASAFASALHLGSASSRSGVAPITFASRSAPAARTPVPAAAALADVLGRVHPSQLERAELTAPPLEAQRGVLPWFHAVIDVPGTTAGEDVAPLWVADLIQGAVAERVGASSDLRDDFGGSSFDVRLPDGKLIPDYGGGMGDITRGQEFSNSSDATIASNIDAAAAKYGLRVQSLNIYRADTAAPAVVTSTDNPASAAANLSNIEAAMFGDPPTYEGYYIEIRSGAEAIVRASAAFRTGAGRFWVKPEFAGASTVRSLGIPPR